jgi:hypothetical protein
LGRDNMGIPKAAADNIKFVLDKYGLEPVPRRPTVIPNVDRVDLARLFAELNFQAGAEIGVERALYSRVLCRENPQAAVYGIDPWQKYRDYREHVPQSKLDGFYREVQERMAPYPKFQPVRKFSMDALGDFEDGELDFVYIDGNHALPFVINDIIEWSKKVRIGGIVSGHDYRKSKRIISTNHVVYAVHCFTESYRLFPWFLLGRKAIIPGERRDDNRSWMWVKIR